MDFESFKTYYPNRTIDIYRYTIKADYELIKFDNYGICVSNIRSEYP